MSRISKLARQYRIKNLENWTIRAILAEAFFLAIFPALAEVAVVVGLGAWFLRSHVDKNFKMRSLSFDLPIAIFVMLGAVSVFMSPASNSELIYNYCWLIGIFGLTYLLVGQNIRTPDQVQLLIRTFSAASLIVVLVGFFQYVFGIDIAEMTWVDGEKFPEFRRHVFSTLGSPNVLAGYLNVMICLALGILSKTDDLKQKPLIITAICVMAACLAMTYSQGAFLAIAVVFLVYGIFQDWRALILFAAVTGLVIYKDPTFLDRILALFTITTDSAEVLRVGVWVSTIAMIADHPFIGIGYGAYQFIYPQYNYYLEDPSTIIRHAHNLYLNVAAEVGIAGALAYFWYFFGTMFTSLSLNSNERYNKIKNIAAKSKFTEEVSKLFMESKFLQELTKTKTAWTARMADLSEKIVDWFSAKSKDDTADKPKKKSEPELVHHEEMKWGKKSGAKSDKKSDDDKMDIQKFAAGDELMFDAREVKKYNDRQFISGVKFGIGLAFLSMAVNGISDNLLFNVPLSILMWQLGALSAAISLMEN